MVRALLGAFLISADAVATGTQSASATPDIVTAQRTVFESSVTDTFPDTAALRDLARAYAEGRGVERDPIVACGFAQWTHASAVWRYHENNAITRAAEHDHEQYCAPLTFEERGAALDAITCPRTGLKRGLVIELEPGWRVEFDRRKAIVEYKGAEHAHSLPDDMFCYVQVVLAKHTRVESAPVNAASTRHMLEFATWRSGRRGESVVRELTWQLWEVRGPDLKLVATESWAEPGSAWPAPSLPGGIAGGAQLTLGNSGEIVYRIPGDAPRRGNVDARQPPGR